ncbi:MAG: TonB-dependent receptor plug domain-containing protein, partial [Porphyromonas sp.]|nr:TonB-dependent receptor plug domain-containing protein [Porphyromonas sp.]
MIRTIFTLLTIFIYCSSFAQQGKRSNANDYREIEEVVVTATRTPKKISNSPVMTQVITAKQIESRGLTDIKSLLSQEVPGLTFNEVGFGTSINMQGLNGKHILFLIDGERIAGETGNNIDYQRINLNNIERIEIVQGAGSAIYGTQAMGGVINIITKKPKDRFQLSLDAKWSPPYQTNYPSIEKGDKYALFKRNADAPNLNGSLTASYRHNKWSTQTTL